MSDNKWSLTKDGKFTDSHKNFRSRIRARVKNDKPLTALQEAFVDWYDNIQKIGVSVGVPRRRTHQFSSRI